MPGPISDPYRGPKSTDTNVVNLLHCVADLVADVRQILRDKVSVDTLRMQTHCIETSFLRYAQGCMDNANAQLAIVIADLRGDTDGSETRAALRQATKP